MQIEARKIVFSGRVQGVGFRMTAAQLSRDLNLRGTIRNMESGDVELMAHGPTEEIETLVTRLREHFGAFIRNVQETPLAPDDPSPADRKNSGIRVIA